jgi:AraC-like DNA-binding protein
MTAMCRLNFGERLDPVSVSLMHPEPICSGDYFAYFRCPLHFDAPANRLTLKTEIMDKRLASDSPQLAQLNDQIMIQYLAQLDKENIVARVKAVIIEKMPSGKVTDQAIAEALYMHARSLQRKLKDEGTTFKTLLNDVRQELAYQYIRDSRLNVNEISFLLGFSDISSFSRAFKRWTGEPPSAYRQQGQVHGADIHGQG